MTRPSAERLDAIREYHRAGGLSGSGIVGDLLAEIDALIAERDRAREAIARAIVYEAQIDALREQVRRAVDNEAASAEVARSAAADEWRSHCERLTADVERLTRERDAARMEVEAHKSERAARMAQGTRHAFDCRCAGCRG